jgi:translation initiation factor 1A
LYIKCKKHLIMPNKKGGKKFKKGKKQSFHSKAMIYKDPKEDQEYGKVIRAMGNGRFEIQCFDGKNRMGILAGNMRKKVWVNKDDIILFSKWEFTTEDDKCSIIHKYDRDESRKLQRDGEFPDFITLDEENDFTTEDMIQFDYGNDKEPSSSEEEEEEKEEEEEIDLDDI